MTATRTHLFVTFGITNTMGKLRFHATNSKDSTFTGQCKRDGLNQPRMKTGAVARTRATGAKWLLQEAAKGEYTKAENEFLSLIAQTGEVKRVRGFHNGRFYQGQAVAAKRA